MLPLEFTSAGRIRPRDAPPSPVFILRRLGIVPCVYRYTLDTHSTRETRRRSLFPPSCPCTREIALSTPVSAPLHPRVPLAAFAGGNVQINLQTQRALEPSSSTRCIHYDVTKPMARACLRGRVQVNRVYFNATTIARLLFFWNDAAPRLRRSAAGKGSDKPISLIIALRVTAGFSLLQHPAFVKRR